jgi:histone H3/H4
MSKRSHIRVLRDNELENAVWFNPALKRMTLKAGVGRTSSLIYPVLLAYADSLLKDVVSRAAIIAINARRTTIQSDDIVLALESMGEKLYPLSETKYVHCKVSTKKTVEGRMREYDNQTQCHYFAKAPFIRALKQETQNHISNARWSDDAVVNVLAFIEAKLLSLIQSAAQATIHAGRTTLIPADLRLISRACFQEDIGRDPNAARAK